MIPQRRLVAFLLLTSVSLAAFIPFSGVGLLWAIRAPVFVVLAFIAILIAFVEPEDIAIPTQSHLSAIGCRAPPLG